MADDFEVRGADQFLALSKALKHAGRSELRKELNKGLRTATKPLIKQTRDKARRDLPSSGGLADQVAREPQRVQVRTGARTAGVRVVVAGKAGGARGANRGRIRHPVFGSRDVWVTQKVPAGWFDDPLEGGADEVRPELEKALGRIAARVIEEAGL